MDNLVRSVICLDEQIDVDVPKDVPVKFSSGAIAPTIKEEGPRRVYTLHSTNLSRAEDDSEGAWEKGVGNGALPVIQVSSYQSWEEVGKWFGGQAYLNTGDEEKAMAHFHKALELDNSAAMLNSVAYSLAEAKRGLNDALHYAEEAVKKTEERSTKADSLDSSNLGVMDSLAAQWDTLGWVKFRLGDYESAMKYLESAWSVMQAPVIGDHLGQVYEKLAKKQQTAHAYAMVVNLLGQNGDPALRQRMNANLTSLAAQGVKPTKGAGGDLSALRSYRASTIKEWGGGYKTATFGIALTKAQGTPLVWFLNGADELKESAAELSKIKFKISFPDDGPTRVVERGMLSCSEAMKSCTLVLLPATAARFVPAGTPQIY